MGLVSRQYPTSIHLVSIFSPPSLAAVGIPFLDLWERGVGKC